MVIAALVDELLAMTRRAGPPLRFKVEEPPEVTKLSELSCGNQNGPGGPIT